MRDWRGGWRGVPYLVRVARHAGLRVDAARNARRELLREQYADSPLELEIFAAAAFGQREVEMTR